MSDNLLALFLKFMDLFGDDRFLSLLILCLSLRPSNYLKGILSKIRRNRRRWENLAKREEEIDRIFEENKRKIREEYEKRRFENEEEYKQNMLKRQREREEMDKMLHFWTPYPYIEVLNLGLIFFYLLF